MLLSSLTCWFDSSILSILIPAPLSTKNLYRRPSDRRTTVGSLPLMLLIRRPGLLVVGRRLQSFLKYRSTSAALFSASMILYGGLVSNICPISVFKPRMKSVTESLRILSFIARLVISSQYSFFSSIRGIVVLIVLYKLFNVLSIQLIQSFHLIAQILAESSTFVVYFIESFFYVHEEGCAILLVFECCYYFIDKPAYMLYSGMFVSESELVVWC
jgi:hypothetical protein